MSSLNAMTKKKFNVFRRIFAEYDQLECLEINTGPVMISGNYPKGKLGNLNPQNNSLAYIKYDI